MRLRALCASVVGPKTSHRGTESAEPSQRGSGSQGSSNRVNRGGSFNNAAVNARSANRNNNTPSNADNNLGLRPAKTSPPPDRRGRPKRPDAAQRDVQTRFLRRCEPAEEPCLEGP